MRMKPEDGLLLALEGQGGGLRAGNMAYSVAHQGRCQQPIHHDKTRVGKGPVH